MAKVVWRRLGRPCLMGTDGREVEVIRRIALCHTGRLYALTISGALWSNDSWGFGNCAWRKERDLPRDIVSMVCSAGLLYFLRRDRSLWHISSGGDVVRSGNPDAADDLAGAEDNTLEFPRLWALNNDRSLWYNDAGGADGHWRRVGRPNQAARIAATQDALFAQNDDGSFWINRHGGDDGSWERLGMSPDMRDLTAASDGRSGSAQLFALGSDSALYRAAVFSTCRVGFATQNAYPGEVWPELDLTALGVSTDIWTMGGYALLASNTMSMVDFLSKSRREVEGRLRDYLRTESLEKDTTDLVIIDIEGKFHPNSFYKLLSDPAVDFSEFIAKFKMRIDVVRRVLRRAQISLYGVVVPDAMVREDKMEDKMRGYRRAAELGLFEDLDYLTPVLYLNWGPSDPGYASSEALSRMAVQRSASLSDKPLAPVLLMKLRGFSSGHHHYAEYVPQELANAQLTYLQTNQSVARIVYWTKPQPGRRNPELYVPPEEIKSFFRRLNPCGR